MYCKKCGAKIGDMAAFCERCGAPVQNQVEPDHGQMQPLQYQQPASTADAAAPVRGKRKKAGMIIGITVAAIALVVGIVIAAASLRGGKGYEKVVDQFMTASFNLDGQAFMELFPDQVVKLIMEDAGLEYSSYERDRFIAERQEDLEKTAELFLGKDWRSIVHSINEDLKYDIENVMDVSGKDLEETQGFYATLGIDVSEAKEVRVKVTVEGTKFGYSDYVRLIKEGNSWYLDGSMQMSCQWIEYFTQVPTN